MRVCKHCKIMIVSLLLLISVSAARQTLNQNHLPIVLTVKERVEVVVEVGYEVVEKVVMVEVGWAERVDEEEENIEECIGVDTVMDEGVAIMEDEGQRPRNKENDRFCRGGKLSNTLATLNL